MVGVIKRVANKYLFIFIYLYILYKFTYING